MVNNLEIKRELINKFGLDVFKNDKLNRKLIADHVFANKSLIEWINSLVHPIVKSDFEEWVKQHNSPFVIKEAAILIESGAHKQCDKIIVVTAPTAIRIERIVMRDNMALDDITRRIANQMSDSERLEYANFEIENDGIKVVKDKVNVIFNKLITSIKG